MLFNFFFIKKIYIFFEQTTLFQTKLCQKKPKRKNNKKLYKIVHLVSKIKINQKQFKSKLFIKKKFC